MSDVQHVSASVSQQKTQKSDLTHSHQLLNGTVDVYQIGCDDAIICDISAYWMNPGPKFPLLQVARWVLFKALKI